MLEQAFLFAIGEPNSAKPDQLSHLAKCFVGFK